MKNTLIFLALLLSISFTASAQLYKTKIKITLNNGDVKYGFAKRKGKTLNFFKSRKTKEKEVINIADIKTFSMAFQEGYKNFEFVKNSRTGKYKLLLLLIDGDYKLYKSFPSQNMSVINNEIDKSIVMSKDGGKSYILFKNFRKEAKKLFADCDVIVEGLNERYFSRLDLGEMILIHNDDCVDVPKDVKAPKIIVKEEPIKVIEEVKESEVVKEVKIKEPVVIKEVKVVRDRLVVNINPIYFSLNKAEIRKDAFDELKKVVDLMHRFPALRIEIGSHTDSRGSDSFNLNLSSKRASATLDYIFNNGIDSKRLTAKGFGETQPVVYCKTEDSCTELEHAKNRRTEFVILNPEVLGY